MALKYRKSCSPRVDCAFQQDETTAAGAKCVSHQMYRRMGDRGISRGPDGRKAPQSSGNEEKEVMPQIDLYIKPISVGIDELQKYEQEPCTYFDELRSTGAALRAAYSGHADMGWVLLEKEYTEELSDGTYIKTLMKLALSVDKGFITYKGTYEGSRSSWLSGFGQLEWVNCPVVSQGDWNRFLAEFDFDCNVHREDQKFIRHNIVGYVYDAPFTDLKRKGEKGSVLLNRLNTIMKDKIVPTSLSAFDQGAAEKRRRDEAKQRMAEWDRSEQARMERGKRFRRRCRTILALQHLIVVCLMVYHNNGYVLRVKQSSLVFAGLYVLGFIFMLSALNLLFKGKTVSGLFLCFCMVALSLAALMEDIGIADYIYVAVFECPVKIFFMIIAAYTYRHHYE